MKDHMPRVLLLVLITGFGGVLLYWLGFDPPAQPGGWIGAGFAFFVWIMLLLSGFGHRLVRFLRILLGWS